jgi:hypothetical protein
MRAQEIRAALDRHWAASDANDFETEHDIYREDAVLEYPQSGERIRGRRNIQITRTNQPSKKRFAVRRVTGGGDLWITEYILTYDGRPSYTVSIMEFSGDKVARETQYFAVRSRPARGALSGSNGWTKGKFQCPGNNNRIASPGEPEARADCSEIAHANPGAHTSNPGKRRTRWNSVDAHSSRRRPRRWDPAGLRSIGRKSRPQPATRIRLGSPQSPGPSRS